MAACNSEPMQWTQRMEGFQDHQVSVPCNTSDLSAVTRRSFGHCKEGSTTHLECPKGKCQAARFQFDPFESGFADDHPAADSAVGMSSQRAVLHFLRAMRKPL